MFCLNYYPFKKYVDEVQELKIIYNPDDKTLPDFLQKYKDKSIVIDVQNDFEDVDAELFQNLYEKYHNIKLIINFNNKDHIERIKKHQIPYFFANSVTTIDQLYGLLKYKPTDMYICEELGFFLDKVSKILHDNNIKLRIYPNICQSSFSETESIKTFFVRPEDISVYATFVDVFELIADEQRQQVIYKVYKQEKWFGNINDLIPTFKGNLNSRYLLNPFGMIRTKCGKRCMYKSGSCDICERFIDISEVLKKNKIVINRKKKKS